MSDGSGCEVALARDQIYDLTAVVEVAIPNNYWNVSVKKIAEKGFSSLANLQKVILPDSLTSIGSRTFYGCTSLMNVELRTV